MKDQDDQTNRFPIDAPQGCMLGPLLYLELMADSPTTIHKDRFNG